MSYAIVGFGKIAQALTHAFARKDMEVTVASPRPPAEMEPQARAIGPKVVAKSLEEALKADTIFLAVPLASQFFIAISASHFSVFFFAVQLVAGLLLLSGYFIPLALVLLAAEIFNILAFHLTMAPATIGPGLLVAVLGVLVFLQHRPSFDGILSAKRFN